MRYMCMVTGIRSYAKIPVGSLAGNINCSPNLTSYNLYHSQNIITNHFVYVLGNNMTSHFTCC